MTNLNWLICLFDKDVDSVPSGKTNFKWKISTKRSKVPLMKAFKKELTIKNFTIVN